jgi:hypothetical protein
MATADEESVPIFKAVTGSARQIFQLINCIRFAPQVNVQITGDGMRFAVEVSKTMQGMVPSSSLYDHNLTFKKGSLFWTRLSSPLSAIILEPPITMLILIRHHFKYLSTPSLRHFKYLAPPKQHRPDPGQRTAGHQISGLKDRMPSAAKLLVWPAYVASLMSVLGRPSRLFSRNKG